MPTTRAPAQQNWMLSLRVSKWGCTNGFAAKAAFNKRLYVFAGDLVYEVWRDSQGLQQRWALQSDDVKMAFLAKPIRSTSCFRTVRAV